MTASSSPSATAILIQILSSLLLYCLVFGMTATVDILQMKKQLYNIKAILIGICIQFIILPFISFCTILIFQLPIEIGIILLVITSSPGGSYSNWWCSMFNADLALSVTMTACSTLFAIVLLPMNIFLYTKLLYSQSILESLDWTSLIVSLVIVFSGILSGLYVSHYYSSKNTKTTPTPNDIVDGSSSQGHNNNAIDVNAYTLSIEDMHRNANRLGNISGLALILLSITVSSISHHDHGARIWDQDVSFYIACAIPPIVGLSLAILLGSHYKLQKPERVAVSIESCYQNTGIATTVALTMFTSSDQDGAAATAIGVPLYYGIVEAIVIFIFCIICWKCDWTKAPSNENICKVISTSYEVLEQNRSNNAEQQQQETTSIEIVFGDHHASAPGANIESKKVNMIFTTEKSDGHYVVDEQTVKQNTVRMNTLGGNNNVIDDNDNQTVSSTVTPSSNPSTSEPDGIMIYEEFVTAPTTVPDSPTLTENTYDNDDTNSVDIAGTNNNSTIIDQLRRKSRLGGGRRKTIVSNFRAYATGYRRPHLPYSYNDDDQDYDNKTSVLTNYETIPETTVATTLKMGSIASSSSNIIPIEERTIMTATNVNQESEQQMNSNITIDRQIGNVISLQQLQKRQNYSTVSTDVSPRNDDNVTTATRCNSIINDDDISL